MEVQILLHAADVRVVQVCAIEIVDPVHKTDIAEDKPVDLEEEVLLFARCRWLAPDSDAQGM